MCDFIQDHKGLFCARSLSVFLSLSFTHLSTICECTDHEYGMPFGIRSTVVICTLYSTDSSNKQITSLRICIFIIAAIELLTTSLHWQWAILDGCYQFFEMMFNLFASHKLGLKETNSIPIKRTQDSGDELVFLSKNFSAFFNKIKKTISVQFLFLLSVWKSAISLFMMKLWLQ